MKNTNDDKKIYSCVAYFILRDLHNILHVHTQQLKQVIWVTVRRHFNKSNTKHPIKLWKLI